MTTDQAAHAPYVRAVVAAIERAGLDVDEEDGCVDALRSYWPRENLPA